MNSQKGFGILAVVIVLALVAAIGGGVYYSKHKAPMQQEVNTEVESNTDASADVTVGAKSGSIKSLLALGGNMLCTFTSADSSGTMYISGTNMRGDFTASGSESHMIKAGDISYVWTGSQGAKMNFSEMNTSSGAPSQSVNMDENVNYNCQNWTPDTSKFTVPSTVTFIDLKAMMNAAGNINIPQ